MTGTKPTSKRMTQAKVISHCASKMNMPRATVQQVFEELSSLCVAALNQNGEFVLPGFGKLVKSERKARLGRNPGTGEVIQIPARTTVKFRLSKTLKTESLAGDSLAGDPYIRSDRYGELEPPGGGGDPYTRSD